MADITIREKCRIYLREILPPLILENPEEFYAAFEQGPDAAAGFFRNKWAWMCRRLPNGGKGEDCPLRGMDCVALDEREDRFAALLALELTEPEPPESGAPLYLAVFFGVDRMPRLFAGERTELGGAPALEVAEYRLDREGELRRLCRGTLTQGCNNEPLLFSPPVHSLPVDESRPLERDAWYTAFLDRAARSAVG